MADLINTVETINWINKLVEEGSACREYADRIKEAKSKKDFFDFACEVDGAKFLTKQSWLRKDLPLEAIAKDFKNFINGRYKPELKGKIGDGTYTSSLYCLYNEDLVLDTTVTVLLGYCGKITVRENSTVIIIADNTTEFCLDCDTSKGSKAMMYGGVIYASEEEIRRKQEERRAKKIK